MISLSEYGRKEGCGTVQYSTVQYSTVQYSTVQNSTVHCTILQYMTVQYSTLHHNPLSTAAAVMTHAPGFNEDFYREPGSVKYPGDVHHMGLA